MRPVHMPGDVSASSTVSVLPDGRVTVTGSALSAMVWRSTISWLPCCLADSASSSRSGSSISQWAMRRMSSLCGPPPSKPRDHSQP
ncbi:MAG: hypothetical protein NTU78_02810 [Alphaproteobacteria bacterium]|nr:hypothetical protein [Alphaproteobacteria bacterium]